MNGTENTQPGLDLSATERTALEALAGGEPPFNQRAKALLAVADGADLAGAAIGADLTENQVRHWLGRFRNGRLAVFPEDLLPSTEEIAQIAEAEPALLSAPPESPKLQAPPKLEELPAGAPDPGNVIELPATMAAAGAVAAGTAAAKKSKKKDKAKKKKKSGQKAKKSKKDSDKKGKKSEMSNKKKQKKNDGKKKQKKESGKSKKGNKKNKKGKKK